MKKYLAILLMVAASSANASSTDHCTQPMKLLANVSAMLAMCDIPTKSWMAYLEYNYSPKQLDIWQECREVYPSKQFDAMIRQSTNEVVGFFKKDGKHAVCTFNEM